MPTRKTDIHFASDDAQQFLPSLIAVMSFLATLLLCVGIAINSWLGARQADYSRSFTVNIPSSIANLDDAIAKTEKNLQHMEYVRSVERLTDEELHSMLSPWLGESEGLSGLPLPVVLHVTLKSTEESRYMDYKELERILRKDVRSIEVEAQEQWVATFNEFSGLVQGTVVIVAILVLVAMGALVMYTSRASLHLHAPSVQLLHAIGAEDDYIAQQFQRQAFYLVLPGALVGCFAAAAIYAITSLYIGSLELSLLPNLSITLSHYGLWIMFAPLCAIASWVVSAMAIRKQLKAVL